MISVPTYNQFRFYFNKTFIYQKVKERFRPGFEALNYGLYNDITDYLNSTVVKVIWPGIADDSTTKQYGVKKGSGINRSRTNKGGKAADELVSKELTVVLSVKESYVNWLLLYCNWLEHFKLPESEKKIHLPDCGMHIMDDNGSVLMSIVFTGITFLDMEKMEFNVTDNKFINRDFQLSLTYNDFDMRFYLDNEKREADSIIV